MKFIEGQTIRDRLHAKGPFALGEAVLIARQVCDGLRASHARGFVHRDIKPHNLMLDARGRCTILDFGVLRLLDRGLTLTGAVVGTPSYASPEQVVLPELVGPPADLYALAVTVFEMLTGKRPYLTATDALQPGRS